MRKINNARVQAQRRSTWPLILAFWTSAVAGAWSMRIFLGQHNVYGIFVDCEQLSR